jgi:hypothetical protein
MSANQITPIKSSEIVFSGFKLSDKGLEAIDQPTFEQWVECGNFIQKSSESVHFWIGDWLNYGEVKYGETYRKAAEIIGYSMKTLKNDKWVASRVPPERRSDKLSFSHHETVADLDPEEQEELLKEAQEKKINNENFRKIVAQRDLPVSKKEEPKVETSRARDDLEDVVKISTLNSQLLAAIDSCNFDNLPVKARDELLKNLKKTYDRITGLMMRYTDDE